MDAVSRSRGLLILTRGCVAVLQFAVAAAVSKLPLVSHSVTELKKKKVAGGRTSIDSRQESGME
jgi:hypothetical protein